MTDATFYTYMHTRNDTGECFYVGKGKGNRAFVSAGRGSHWERIAAKHGHTTHILSKWKSEKDAFEHEKFLIQCFRSLGKSLINKTDGGEGVVGWSPSDEQKKLMSERMIDVSSNQQWKIEKSNCMKSLWEKSEFKKTLLEAQRISREKESYKQNLKLAKSKQDYKEKLSAKTKAWMENPQNRMVTSNAVKAAMKRPEVLAKLSKKVLCVDKNIEFDSLNSAVEWLKLNVFEKANRVTMSKALNGKKEQAYGLVWRFVK